jgi:hypothetical protein
MAINNFSGRTHGIRTVTNVADEWKDNDEYVGNRSHNEHNPAPSSNPWATTYKAPEPVWQEEPAPPLQLDPELKAAIKRDLKIRNIYTNTDSQ